MKYLSKIVVVASPVLVGVLMLGGCGGGQKNDGEQPGVVVPDAGGGPGGTKSNGGGSNASRGSGGGDRVLAEIEGVKVTESQVTPVLFDAYGLDVLLKITQLNMAKAAAAGRGVTVSPSDVEAEKQLTMSLAFPDQKPEDYPQLLKQLLAQQRVSQAEFEAVMQTNAYLRAVQKPQALAGMTAEAVREEFNQLYGERVRVRHIALNNLQEVAEAKSLLAQPNVRFEAVAMRMSKNPATARIGGELAPFARTSPGYGRQFLDAAFALKPGEISDPIQDGAYYHIIKVEERIEPRAVKFEDVQDSVRESLIARRTNALMAASRAAMAQQALRDLRINEPTLKRQFDERVAAANPQPADKSEVQRSLDAERDRGVPATAPAATNAATPPQQPSRAAAVPVPPQPASTSPTP